MNERNQRDRPDFDRAFSDWGRRSPRTTPETAARRVVKLITASRASRPKPRLAWVAATILLAAAGMWFVVRNGGDGPPVAPHPIVADVTPLPLDDNVVLWWLDEETPVYFVLQGPEDEETRDDDPEPR